MKISGILFGQLSMKPLNCEHEVKNPQDLYAVGLWKYGTIQLAMYYVLSLASTCYFLILRHSGVFKPTLRWPTGTTVMILGHDLPQRGLGLPQLYI